MTTKVQDLIDLARIQHHAFSEQELGDGAALLFLKTYQRTLMLRYKDAIRTIVNQTMNQAGVVSGQLVGLDGNGNPYFLNTYQDGYPVQFNANNVPFIDTSAAPISYDPFGAVTGNPGWPMPVDAIAFLSLTAVYVDGTQGPIDMVDQTVSYAGPPSRYPAVFMTGARLVPLRRQPIGGAPDIWTSVQSVTLNYIPFPTIAAMTDAITLPGPLVAALVAGIAELLARQNRKLSAAERAEFTAARKEAEAQIALLAPDMLGDFKTENVVFEGDIFG